MNSKKWFKTMLITLLFLSFIVCFVPFSSAHILIIGDSNSDIPDAYSETKSIATLLKSKGYQVYEVYKNNATTKNILKGMYGTSWIGADIVKDFINGAKNFKEANKINFEIITKSTVYKNTVIWRNTHGYSAFIGNWLGTFPKVSETTKYNETAAEAWYKSDRSKNPFQPDLTVPSVINPKKGLKGHSISISVVVKNIANATSSSFFVTYYLKHDPTNAMIYLGNSFVSSLSGKSVRTVKKTVILSTKISKGNYYIAAHVDSGKTNAETNENNNFKASANKTFINYPYRDLLSSSLNATIYGKKLLVSNTVKNRGNIKTNSYYVNYYLKQTGQTELGTYVGRKYFNGLSSSSSISRNIQFTLNKSYNSNYKLVSYIDPQMKIKESNRTNNIKICSIKSTH